MGYRIVEISKPAEIHINKGILNVAQKDGSVTIPIEDIATMIFHGPAIRISTMALSMLAEENIQVVFCNNKNMPISMLAPVEGNYQQSLVMHKQIALSKEFRDLLWQRIIIQKIENQADALQLINRIGSQDIRNFSVRVEPGDKNGSEAAAAKAYFQLYYPGLNRREENPRNSALNYGYSIIRTNICRKLYFSGFIPSIGIHHENQFNAFNLADDLIEPFRPIVDIMAHRLNNTDIKLSKDDRWYLTSVLHNACMLDNKTYSVANAIDVMINSFRQVVINGDLQKLMLPKLLKLERLNSVRG